MCRGSIWPKLQCSSTSVHGVWKLDTGFRVPSWERTVVGYVEMAWRRKGDREWDGWIASPMQWTRTWANFRKWWGTGRSGTLWSMELQIQLGKWTTTISWDKAVPGGVEEENICENNGSAKFSPRDGGSGKSLATWISALLKGVPSGHLVESTSHTALICSQQAPACVLRAWPPTGYQVLGWCEMPSPVGGCSGWPHVTPQPQAQGSFLLDHSNGPELDSALGLSMEGKVGKVMSVFCLFVFYCWPASAACRILVPQLCIESLPSAVKVQSPNHSRTTREFLVGHFLSLADGPEVWRWLLRGSLLWVRLGWSHKTSLSPWSLGALWPWPIS